MNQYEMKSGGGVGWGREREREREREAYNFCLHQFPNIVKVAIHQVGALQNRTFLFTHVYIL